MVKEIQNNGSLRGKELYSVVVKCSLHLHKSMSYMGATCQNSVYCTLKICRSLNIYLISRTKRDSRKWTVFLFTPQKVSFSQNGNLSNHKNNEMGIWVILKTNFPTYVLTFVIHIGVCVCTHAHVCVRNTTVWTCVQPGNICCVTYACLNTQDLSCDQSTTWFLMWFGEKILAVR